MVIYFNETWQSEEGSTTAYNAFNISPVSQEDYDYLNDLICFNEVSKKDQECQTDLSTLYSTVDCSTLCDAIPTTDAKCQTEISKIDTSVSNMNISTIDTECQTNLTEPPQRIYISGKRNDGQYEDACVMSYGVECIISEGEIGMAYHPIPKGNGGVGNLGEFIGKSFGSYISSKMSHDPKEIEKRMNAYFNEYKKHDNSPYHHYCYYKTISY
jgi:hypothetical protein